VGVPYCVTTHGISKLPDTPESANLSWWQIPIFEYGFFKPYLQILGNADHLFALSKHDRERIRTHFPDQSVSITPNGVQLNPPKARDNRDAKRTFGIPEEIPVLLFAGKILKSKGIDDLIAVHETIEAKHKMIVAGEPEDEEFVAKLETTDSDLEYVGYTSRDELNLLFRRADLFIFPTRTDVFPLVVLEAMAAKTPVVSTTVGGIPEQVSDEVGVLVPPQQPRMMAKEIDELLSNKSQRDRLSENAFDRIKNNYTWSQIAKRVADKYSELDSTS
jgi:glycosyltransferase involved in cell wall biosynthesis